MNKEYLKNLIKYLISSKSRKFIHRYRENFKADNIKLIMTLVVKNEETVIEKNIRFHCAMGVDGFIVTNHNSTDKTSEILNNLKDEGLVLEIIDKNSPDHKHHLWVNEMIKMAKTKYKADWVINADADEFYYSKDLDLKRSIYEYAKAGVNALWVDSTMVFPQNVENFYENKYWGTKSFQDFEVKKFDIPNTRKFEDFIVKEKCPKIIHSMKGFISGTDGNHYIKMKNLKQVPCANITLYHYHVPNYKGFEAKVLRWLDSAKYMPDYQGEHVKEMINLYKEGRLEDRFNDFYGDETRNFLIDLGLVSIDRCVCNFMEYKGII